MKKFKCGWCEEFCNKVTLMQERQFLCDDCRDETGLCFDCGDRFRKADLDKHEGHSVCNQCYNERQDRALDHIEGKEVRS